MRAKNVHVVRTGQRLTIAHMQTSDRVRNLVVVVGLHAVNQHHKGVTLESMMNCPSSLDYHPKITLPSWCLHWTPIVVKMAGVNDL